MNKLRRKKKAKKREQKKASGKTGRPNRKRAPKEQERATWHDRGFGVSAPEGANPFGKFQPQD